MGLVGSWDPGIWLGIGWGPGLAVLGVSFGVLLGRPGELAGGQFWGPGGQVLGSGWGPG